MEDNKVWFKPTQTIKYNKDKDLFGIAIFDFETKEMRVYDAELVEVATATILSEEQKREETFYILTMNFDEFFKPALDYIPQHNDALIDIMLADLVKQFIHHKDVIQYPYSREELAKIMIDFYYFIYYEYSDGYIPVFYEDTYDYWQSLENFKIAVENYEKLFNYTPLNYYKNNIVKQYIKTAIDSPIFTTPTDAAQ